MKPVNFILIIFTSLLLQACSPDNTPKTKLFEEQRNALDKAKAVDSTMQQQTQQSRENEEKQTQ